MSKTTSLLDSNEGIVIVSLVLGFGLATLFRKVCKDNNCMVIKGPKQTETEKYFYKIDEKCYKYTPKVVDCDKDAVIVQS